MNLGTAKLLISAGITAPGEAGSRLDILVNGKLPGVPVRGTVRDVLRESGIPGLASHQVETLRITRPYKGKPVPIQFDSSRHDILDLVLIGGEEVSWQ